MTASVLKTQGAQFIAYSRSISSNETVTMIVRRVPHYGHFTSIRKTGYT